MLKGNRKKDVRVFYDEQKMEKWFDHNLEQFCVKI